MASKEIIPLIALTGPEGSGKTTQAKFLAEKLHLPYISTGDILRNAAVNDKSELGDACRKMFSEHVYLSPVLILQILGHRLAQKDTEHGAVLDGGFRTVDETINFAAMLETTGRNFTVNVFYIRIPKWKALERTLGERQRPDDTKEAVLSRLSAFYTGLGERMSYIRNHWGLLIVDGNQAPSDIGQKLLVVFSEQGLK